MVTQGQGFSKPQFSKTGVGQPKTTKVECGVDWIAGTIQQSNAFAVMAMLASFFSDEFVEQQKGTGWYRDSYRSALGMVAGLHPHGEGRTDSYISIPGSVLAGLSGRKVQLLMKRLHEEYQFHCSRLDLKIDDYTKTVTPELAYQAYQDDNVSGFRSHHWHSSGNKQKGIGNTLELGKRGSKGSGKFLRIYDKFIESGGKIDATRIELELSGDFALQYFAYLATLPYEEFCKWIVNIICSCVKFVQRDKDGRLRNAELLPWWAFIAKGREKISLCNAIVVSSVEKAKQWISKQVAPMLATILNSCSNETEWNEFLWDAIFNGESRMQDRHNAMVNAEKTRRRIKVTLISER